MYKYATILIVLLLTSCTPTSQERTSEYDLPNGLKDCTIYRLESIKQNILYVVRCPESNTTTRTSGKFPANVSVINTEKDTLQDKINELESVLHKQMIEIENMKKDR